MSNEPLFSNENSGKIDPTSNHCFGCGPLNPIGLRLQFFVEPSPSGEVTTKAHVQLSRLYEGGAGYIHGGVIATLMDEAMSKLNKVLGVSAVTRQMEVEYLRPSLVDTRLVLLGRHIRREGRKLFHRAELLNEEGEVLARANAVFIAIERSQREMPADTPRTGSSWS